MEVIATDASDIPMTAEGFDRHCHELERLRHEERGRLTELLREARLEGSLEDNPTLADLLEEQVLLERRIAKLDARLAVARIAPPPRDGRVGIGSVVRVRDVATGDVFEYTLVGSLEGDPARGRISAEAPIGRALLGHVHGAHVEATPPRGAVVLEILDVDHQQLDPALERDAA